MNIPVFDLHCDTARALLGSSLRECGSLRENQYHIDLTRAGRLSSYAQCFACFTKQSEGESKPVEIFEREMVTVLREVEKNQDIIAVAYTAEDIENNRKNGLMSAILTIVGTAGIAFDPDLLSDLYCVGFRMSTLGWNESNPLSGSHITGEGLTDLGRAYVKQAQENGIIIDVSHISDKGFWDIMDITQAPVIASHSNSRTICNVSRNITDDMFLAICHTGGTVGINLFHEFVGNGMDINAVCDHILHFLDIDPDGTHISIGGDLDGCDKLVKGVEGIQDYPDLADCLLTHGLDKDTIYNIFWNNAIGVMKRCCM